MGLLCVIPGRYLDERDDLTFRQSRPRKGDRGGTSEALQLKVMIGVCTEHHEGS